LVDAVAEHVIGGAHDETSECIAGQLDGIARGALVAFDIQLDAAGEAVLGAVEVMSGADDAIACHCQEGTAEGIEVRGGWRIGMCCGALSGPLLVGPESATDTLCVPRLPAYGLGLEVLGDKPANVWISARVAGLRVARQLVDTHLERRHDFPARVIAQCGQYVLQRAWMAPEDFEQVRVRGVSLVFDRFASYAREDSVGQQRGCLWRKSSDFERPDRDPQPRFCWPSTGHQNSAEAGSDQSEKARQPGALFRTGSCGPTARISSNVLDSVPYQQALVSGIASMS
jgi:hypothetical protein